MPSSKASVNVAGGDRTILDVDPVDGHFLVPKLDRDVDLLGGDVLADVDRAHLALALLDVQPLLAHGDADLALGSAARLVRLEVLAPLGAEVQAILVHALEGAHGNPPLADVGVLVVVAIDRAVLAIVGAEDLQPLAELALQIHWSFLR